MKYVYDMADRLGNSPGSRLFFYLFARKLWAKVVID